MNIVATAQEDIREAKRRLFSHFPAYSEALLKVNVREGKKRVPFKLRPAQLWLHQQLEAEHKERGFVRALVPKARQLGCSTYIGGRFFEKTANNEGTNTYILSHTSESTSNVFKMVKGFYGDLEKVANVFDVLPELSNSNARELVFPKLSSQYRVQTAEGTDVGVGTTNQLLHLSEVALYKNSRGLSMGLMNTVHLMPGTEIIMESTGRGPTGMFYQMCQQALHEENKGLWRVYFMPWSWDPDYVFDNIPENFVFPTEFLEYQMLHRVTNGQLYWFYLKNVTIASQNGGTSDEIHQITKQEYPITLDECFQSATESAFYKPEHIARARNAVAAPMQGMPRLLAVDPALDGDLTFLADRQGLAIGSRIWQSIREPEQTTQADIIVNLAFRHNIDAIIVDATGLGIGLVNLLRLKLENRIPVVPIVFSTKANNPLAYVNKRAEMFDLYRLFMQGQGYAQPSIPNDDILISEMACIQWGVGQCHRDYNNRLQITAKENIKKQLNGKSTDRLDAVILTTAFSDSIIADLMNKQGN